MATYTTAELATRVLQKLGVLAAGSSARAEDSALVTAVAGNCIAELQNQGSLGDFATDAIPDYLFEGLVFYVMPYVAMEFGKPVDTGARNMGLMLMRNAVANRDIKDPAPAVFY